MQTLVVATYATDAVVNIDGNADMRLVRLRLDPANTVDDDFEKLYAGKMQFKLACVVF